MLRISKMTDYAVVLATHLAAAEGPSCRPRPGGADPDPGADGEQGAEEAGASWGRHFAAGCQGRLRACSPGGADRCERSDRSDRGADRRHRVLGRHHRLVLRVRDQLRGQGQLAANQRRGSPGAFRDHAGGHGGSPAPQSSCRSRARARRPSKCARPARRATTSTELE